MESSTVITLVGVGFGASFIDSIAGGGGLLMVPAFLTAGIPPHITLGTNKLSATLGVATAVRTYIKKGYFKPSLWIAATLAALIGAVIGALLTHIISSKFLQLFLPVAVIVIAIYALWPKKQNSQFNDQYYKPRKRTSSLMGGIIGFYDGFLGPGTGSFWTSALMYFYKMDMLAASGVARFMNFISNLVALITFCILGNVDYELGLAVGVAMMLGSYLGSYSAIKYGAKFIKPIFVTVVVLLAIHLIYLEWL